MARLGAFRIDVSVSYPSNNEVVIIFAALVALVFGPAASFLMSRAANVSAAANIGFGALFMLALAGLIFLIVIVTERVTFG